MSPATATQEIVVEYTTIEINSKKAHVVQRDLIQLIVDQGVGRVEEVRISTIEAVASIIVEQQPRPAQEMLEELYIYALCKLGFVPGELIGVCRVLRGYVSLAHIRGLAEDAAVYKSHKALEEALT